VAIVNAAEAKVGLTASSWVVTSTASLPNAGCMMTIEYRDAKRGQSPLLVLLAGSSGSGKTESAMRLATGMSDGAPFAVIDSENGRALHKADDYTFKHGNLEAPFTPERYTEAVAAADAAGFPVIIIDSGSHEYDGVGGVLDMQADEFKRMGERESARMSSWIEPKRRHKQFVQQLLRTRAHVIMCLRAEDKIEIVKANGKTEVRPKASLTGLDGWIPICERRLPFEATISVMLTPDAPGVPKPIKLERRHADFVPLNQPLSEQTGRQLAAWAAGSSGEPNGQASGHEQPAQATEGAPNAPTSDVPPAASGGEPASPDDIYQLTARLVGSSTKPQEAAYMIEMKAKEQTPAEHLEWLRVQERKHFAGGRGGDS
jgi:hypothetical protein